ncbi:hypothetical protein Tco_0249469, partial [Tanacetum coccineum]
ARADEADDGEEVKHVVAPDEVITEVAEVAVDQVDDRDVVPNKVVVEVVAEEAVDPLDDGDVVTDEVVLTWLQKKCCKTKQEQSKGDELCLTRKMKMMLNEGFYV